MRETLNEAYAHRFVIIGLLAAVIVLLLLEPLLQEYTALVTNPSQLRAFIMGFGILAPIMYILIHLVQIVFAPIPGQIIYVAGGYTFGVVDGILYGLTGMAIGSFLAILVGDRIGRRFVSRLIHKDSLERFDELAETYGYTPYFMIFLLPGFPDDAVCLLGGMSSLDTRHLWGFALIGRIPEVIALTLVGNSLALSQTTLFYVLLFTVLAVSLLAMFFRQRILHTGSKNG